VTLRGAVAAAAFSLLLVPCALASGAATPNEIALAKTLKTEMQRTYNARHAGTRFTTVTCRINAAGTGARCVAHFTRKAQGLKGSYRVTVAADAAGNASWKATSVSCANLRTGAKVEC
jgi:hypothetical protein